MQKIIGLVHTRYSPIGGVENYINNLVPDLLNRNWEVHYFTGKIEQPVPDGMIVHNIPIIRGTSISRMLSFAYSARKKVRRVNLPLVMGFGRTIYQDIYCDGSGCFLDYQKHTIKRFNPLYRTSYLHLERKRFNDPHLQKVVAISNMVKEQIVHRHHLSPEKIEVIYPGVDPDQFHPRFKEKKISFKKKLGIPEDALTLLFIGNEFERKGLRYLIEAFGSLPSELSISLLVAGKDKHEARYRRLAQMKGCSQRIYFLGYQKDVSQLFAAADLFVFPSLFDAFAIVVLESLCSGTPVITGPQVGASELIDHGINGFVVSDFKPETLTDAILTFYNSGKKEEMAVQAHHVAEAYRWDWHVDKLEK